MTVRSIRGAALLCRSLERLGVDCVFGVPGSQLLELFEALRRSRIRTVLANSEQSAAFMANGYARASGKPGVLITISGPGFLFSLPGVAEAMFDSAPLVHIVNKPAAQLFAFQDAHQQAMAQPVVKAAYNIEPGQDIPVTLATAFAAAMAGEPGPVMVQVAGPVFVGHYRADLAEMELPPPDSVEPDPEQVDEVARRLSLSSRTMIYCGQGANFAPQQVHSLAEFFRAAVVTTRSARGIVPEDHPLALVFNSDHGCSAVLNRMVRECSLVLAIGCKLSRNSADGLQLPPEKLVRVDASAGVLGANYPASLAICADVPRFLTALARRIGELHPAGAGWQPQELACWQRKLDAASIHALHEPSVPGLSPPTPQSLFAALRRAMPRDSCLVIDSGRHQVLARVHARVLSPRGMIVPSDLQSMGFALPAAIGAKLAMRGRSVVALLGDGCFAISGLELCTAVREKLPITVIVFNDGALGLIRDQQFAAFGFAHATQISNPVYPKLAEAVGIPYFRVEGDAEKVLSQAIAHPGVSLVEVVVGTSPALRARRAGGLAKAAARSILGPTLFQKLRTRAASGRRKRV